MEFLAIVFIIALVLIPSLAVAVGGLSLTNRGISKFQQGKKEIRAMTRCVVCGQRASTTIVCTGNRAYVICDNPACYNAPMLEHMHAQETGQRIRGRKSYWVDMSEYRAGIPSPLGPSADNCGQDSTQLPEKYHTWTQAHSWAKFDPVSLHHAVILASELNCQWILIDLPIRDGTLQSYVVPLDDLFLTRHVAIEPDDADALNPQDRTTLAQDFGYPVMVDLRTRPGEAWQGLKYTPVSEIAKTNLLFLVERASGSVVPYDIGDCLVINKSYRDRTNRSDPFGLDDILVGFDTLADAVAAGRLPDSFAPTAVDAYADEIYLRSATVPTIGSRDKTGSTVKSSPPTWSDHDLRLLSDIEEPWVGINVVSQDPPQHHAYIVRQSALLNLPQDLRTKVMMQTCTPDESLAVGQMVGLPLLIDYGLDNESQPSSSLIQAHRFHVYSSAHSIANGESRDWPVLLVERNSGALISSSINDYLIVDATDLPRQLGINSREDFSRLPMGKRCEYVRQYGREIYLRI